MVNRIKRIESGPNIAHLTETFLEIPDSIGTLAPSEMDLSETLILERVVTDPISDSFAVKGLPGCINNEPQLKLYSQAS